MSGAAHVLGAQLRELTEIAHEEDDEHAREAIANTLEGLALEFDESILALARVTRQLARDNDDIDDELARLQERRKRKESRAKAVRAYMLDSLTRAQRRSVRDALLTVSVMRGREAVHIDDAAALPSQLLRTKPEVREPMKAAIAEQIKAGETVPGARLVRGPDTVSIR